MDPRLLRIIGQSLKRNAVLLIILALLAALYIAYKPQIEIVGTGEEENEQLAAAVLPQSEPKRIRIPAIELEAPFEAPLGVNENREVEVPKSYDTVGWYKYGPTPGELGPSVILGHVDSREGPEVFYDLRELEEGDLSEIDREDGSTAVFEVTRLRTVSQESFPTMEVYGNIDHAGLRLITCSGTFDQGTQRYSHNLIVFARLVTEESS